MKFFQPLVFIVTFIVVTGALIVLNSMFTNIFKLDFTPVTTKAQVSDSTKTNKPSFESLKTENKKTPVQDSVKSASIQPVKEPVKADTTKQISPAPQITQASQTTTVKDSPLLTTQNETPDTTNAAMPTRFNSTTGVDSAYIRWVKATAAMYESMDPKKAARIIQDYSEQVARDIIYKMKKKKAADILAELDPAVANRIARYGG